ncbi:MAG TPA: ATP-binding protein [Aquabacterium sp.]|uniref:ATP-binding protein n=1 Tax=Aquabacterium sp. TaxID=1872578 RepID=UPI002E2F61FC|nr:ATP-binding protein [Aquabacterium sp.]HEX5373481.1 ATP-binding protein [Aquabacterium sp.]
MAERDTPDFQLLFESVPGLYLVLTPDLCIAAVSNDYLHATKTERAQIIGRHLFEVFPDNPDDDTASGVSNLRASLQRVLTSHEPDWMPLQKYDIRRPDAEGGGFEERYWSCLNSPVLDEQGALRLITHRAEDVTEFVHLRQRGAEQDKVAQELRGAVERAEAEVYLRAEQVARANEQLQARNTALHESESRLRRLASELEVINAEMTDKNQMLEESSRMKSEFLSNMSHELRTPLNAIIGFSELLKDGLVGPLEQRQRDYMGHIFDGGQHLLALINDILDMSKVDAGKVELQFEAVDVQAALADGLRVVEDKAHAKQLRLDSQVSLPMGEVVVDARRFKQILYNLLSNAVKFTPPGGQIALVAKRVNRLEASSSVPGFPVGRRTTLPPGDGDDFLEISVTDSGIGMRPQDLKQLFTPFTQIKHPANRGIEGTGLGLAMVLRLAELHGGAVAVSSEPDRGTCFSVWLPWRQEAAPALDADSPAVRGWALVVEDDERAATLMGLQLQTLGFAVRHVRSAEAALALSDELVPDLITLDIMLPGMDGWAFLRRLKTLPQWAQVPVVVVSVQPDGALAKSLGVSLALQKPLRFDELKQGLDRLGLKPGEQEVTALIVDDDRQAVEVLAQPLQQLGCVVLRAYGGPKVWPWRAASSPTSSCWTWRCPPSAAFRWSTS